MPKPVRAQYHTWYYIQHCARWWVGAVMWWQCLCFVSIQDRHFEETGSSKEEVSKIIQLIFIAANWALIQNKDESYQCRKSHCGDKTVVRSSYLHYGISYTGKMPSFYWIGALVLFKTTAIASIMSTWFRRCTRKILCYTVDFWLSNDHVGWVFFSEYSLFYMLENTAALKVLYIVYFCRTNEHWRHRLWQHALVVGTDILKVRIDMMSTAPSLVASQSVVMSSSCAKGKYSIGWDLYVCVCLRLSQLSQLSFMQYMGLCVFSLPISLVIIARIRALYLIMNIRSDVKNHMPLLIVRS